MMLAHQVAFTLHDTDQVHPEHKPFSEEQKANWQHMRVFDSNVASGR